VTQDEELTIETLRPLAQRAGLQLTDDELAAVLPGVKRNIEYAAVCRKWAARNTEPQVGGLPEGAAR
jgi:hypothetical protein